MKKMLAIAAAMLLVLPVLAMAGMTAFDNMTELGPEMADVTGQVGITIDTSVQVTDGFLAWGDSDGYTGVSTGAWLKLDNLTVNDGTVAPGPMDQTGLTLDAGATANTAYLVVGLPSISGQISIGAVYIGTAADFTNPAESLGSITIGDLSVATSTLKISAH